MTATDPRRAIDAVFRIDSPRLIASLARMTGDIGLAEDFAQDALVAALQQWPDDGIPDRPGAWLMATAKRRAIDHFRRSKVAEQKLDEVARLQGTQEESEGWTEPRDGDDLLSLIMTCCHPILPVDSRVALTLRLLGGLSTREIARGFLVSEPTVAQRIARAKRTLAEARVPFENPEGAELNERLDSILRVLYLIFNEGYSSTSGQQWIRPSLCEDALRMGRVLAELIPDEPEVHALVALMEIQASRIRARIDEAGRPALLADQNRARWDRLLIGRGLSALDRAEKLGRPAAPYLLQAAIAACHATAPTIEQTDWERITSLYELLVKLTGSPVVELNHAVALGMAKGPEAGLEAVDRLRDEPALRAYPLLPSARGDLLEKLDRLEEAAAEFSRAARLAQNDQERQLMLDRAKACKAGTSG
ncbi:MAG: RNA polymerase sigma factor [Actinobacteria bacterium]|nr:RNA polymerase sigma factor [Actinomycetota bacterium]